MVKNDFKTVDEYIQSFPKKTQVHLKSIRAAIKSVAPEASEQISYCMPAYKVNKKPFIYFGAYEKHIGFYATPNTHEKFAKHIEELMDAVVQSDMHISSEPLSPPSTTFALLKSSNASPISLPHACLAAAIDCSTTSV